MRPFAIAAVIAAAASTAHAGDATIDRTAGSAADRCARARSLVERDLTAALFLGEACPASDPTTRTLRAARDREGFGMLEIVTKPSGAAVVIRERPDLRVRGGDDVWLPAGSYAIEGGGVVSTVELSPGGRALALVELPRDAAPTTHSIEFDGDGGADLVMGPPPPAEHKNLLPERYQKIIAVQGGGGDFADDDDGAVDRAHVGATVRLAGGGLTGWDADLGFAIAALARSHGRLAAQAEIAWVRRAAHRDGASVALDAIEVPIAGHLRLWRGGRAALGVLAGPGLALRLDRTLDGAAIARVGAIGLIGADAELGRFHVELRADLGLTRAGDARPWSLGANVGVLAF